MRGTVPIITCLRGEMVGTGFGGSAMLGARASGWRRGKGFEPSIRSPVQRTWMHLP
jgi:hypothetical protein